MNFLEKTNSIKKYNRSLYFSNEKNGHLNICQVICDSNKKQKKWSHLFPSIYHDCAILMAQDFIDLPGRRFLVRQINEHSRGGHCEYEIYLLDMYGTILNQFVGGYNSKFILDDKYIWFLVSGEKPYTFNTQRDLNLIKLNFNTGKIKQTINLNYPQLINGSYAYIVGVNLSIKHNKGVLQIKYSDEEKNSKTKRILLNDI